MTHIILIPKKENAQSVMDFRPISLTHLIAKLLSKLLANRLAPELNELVSRAQSAFIKRRSIQDNFLYTQNLIKSLHRTKNQGFFEAGHRKGFRYSTMGLSNGGLGKL
jgi:hypothetical protein